MRRTLNRLFSAKNRTMLPALMDGLAVLVFSLPLWVTFLATSDKYSVRELLPPSPFATVTMAGFVGLGSGLSLIGIRYAKRRAKYSESAGREVVPTILMLSIAFGAPFAATFMSDGATNMAEIWQSYATTGVMALPGAIRATTGTATFNPPKVGAANLDAMRAFGVEPGNYDGQGFQAWRHER